MKLAVGFVCSIIAILIGAILIVRSLNHPIPIGPEINGWKVGACYQLSSQNPFDRDTIVQQILDHKGGYIKYEFFLPGTISSWGSEDSGSDNDRKLFTEVSCPKAWWEK
jgi:hypothetical protein